MMEAFDCNEQGAHLIAPLCSEQQVAEEDKCLGIPFPAEQAAPGNQHIGLDEGIWGSTAVAYCFGQT
eukprot:12884466-Prorocentrum_lima.AAC.1